MKKQFKKFLSIFLVICSFLPLKSKAEEETVENPNFELKDISKQSSNLLRALCWFGVPAASVGVLGFLFKDKIFEFLNKEEYLPVVDFSELENRISEAKESIETETEKIPNKERPTRIWVDVCVTKKPSGGELGLLITQLERLFEGKNWSLELSFGDNFRSKYPSPVLERKTTERISSDCFVNFNSSYRSKGKLITRRPDCDAEGLEILSNEEKNVFWQLNFCVRKT
ncbi:MAG: hypothetical protein LBK29_00805 [Oscillospiraceae bacterium]|nr:hypothetical protein [Oscillospiraceae bacterium]